MPTSAQHGRLVAVVEASQTVAAAARLLAESGTDSLVVLSEGAPVGLITDHDLALKVACENADPDATLVGTVMSHPLITVHPGASFAEVVTLMRTHDIRRIPIVKNGRLAGMVELDDLLITLAGEFGDLAECLRREISMKRDVDGPRYQVKMGRIGWHPHLRWKT